ncbi:PPOX class F420-dependent oxidoreductase [Streptomyces xinghaiensis]|uniref:PPOX class F420-dependent oxidoreductase n=1 Tax=Streptomyces xinghaiensis TaxID=1038928 RepID=A0A3R7FNI9_9ACTN|nr:PPOX class F420-dependent oxidoreductase [Streptomyces xinghaiensis]RKM92300.1 PPOX class F420-dependent oxidoreductase [Streptomyces xinghaiensis]RNC70271.1 PPOX class F420-dependent oxidoreductase [Streptomyces xinghaiensis]
MTEPMGKTGDSALYELLQAHHIGTLVTLKRDGRPQLSNVGYAYDPQSRVIRLMVTYNRAKTRNLRRDPRASFYVTSSNGFSYMVAEGEAELTPITTDPHDAVADELVRVFRGFQGEHPDWEGFRAAMVAERRLVIRLAVERVYGAAGRRVLAGSRPAPADGAGSGGPGLQLGRGPGPQHGGGPGLQIGRGPMPQHGGGPGPQTGGGPEGPGGIMVG